jgi:hypothetical protein
MNYDVGWWMVTKRRERERCRDIALRIAAELKNCGIDTEGGLAAERIAKEIMGENSSDG